MPTYEALLHRRDSGFEVEVTSDGVHQTLLGFETKAEATTWVGADRARDHILTGVT